MGTDDILKVLKLHELQFFISSLFDNKLPKHSLRKSSGEIRTFFNSKLRYYLAGKGFKKLRNRALLFSVIILSEVRTSANRVAVKVTVLSGYSGMFILIRR